MSVSDRVVVMQAGVVTQVDEPQRVYEHPRTRFISTFVGKANLLDARVRETGALVGVTLGSLRLDVAVDNPADFTPGAAALLSVRPEKLQLLPRGRGRMDGEVQERFFLGSQWLYRLSTDAGDWTVLCPNDGREALAVGEAAAIDWPDHCMRLLPGEVPMAVEASA